MRLTDEQLRTLVAADPTDPGLLRELRGRVSQQIIRRMPSPRGVWRGRPVVLDDKGPMASGYWGFADSHGYPPVDAWNEIEIVPDSDRERLAALLETLRANR